jgi:hypothetical protein
MRAASSCVSRLALVSQRWFLSRGDMCGARRSTESVNGESMRATNAMVVTPLWGKDGGVQLTHLPLPPFFVCVGLGPGVTASYAAASPSRPARLTLARTCRWARPKRFLKVSLFLLHGIPPALWIRRSFPGHVWILVHRHWWMVVRHASAGQSGDGERVHDDSALGLSRVVSSSSSSEGEGEGESDAEAEGRPDPPTASNEVYRKIFFVINAGRNGLDDSPGFGHAQHGTLMLTVACCPTPGCGHTRTQAADCPQARDVRTQGQVYWLRGRRLSAPQLALPTHGAQEGCAQEGFVA